MPVPRLTKKIAALVDRHANQPGAQVLLIAKRRARFHQLDEHVLHHVFRIGHVSRLIKRHSKNHTLISQNGIVHELLAFEFTIFQHLHRLLTLYTIQGRRLLQADDHSS